MSFYNIYRQYIRNPSNENEEALYLFMIGGEIIVPLPNILSLAEIPSFRIFKLLSERLDPPNTDLLVVKLFELPDRFEHLAYLNSLFRFPSNFVLAHDLNKARVQALAVLATFQKCSCYFKEYIEITDATRYGFFPNNLEFTLAVLEYPGVPLDTLRYHYSNQKLQDRTQSYMIATEDLCRMIQKNHESTILFRLFYPHLLYSSNRLKTDMGMFRTPFSNTGLRRSDTLTVANQLYNSLPLQEGIIEGDYYVPVIRYASSVKAGLYHGLPTKEYCGTFYYLEEESDICLVGNIFLVAQTKCSASKYLFENYDVDERLSEGVERVTSRYLRTSRNTKWEKGEYKPDLMYTPEELVKEGFPDKQQGGMYYNEVPQVPLYSGKQLGLYAEEDEFDQPLCLLAKDVGIDVVVLTRMVGSHQIVTEVLDCRSREESLINLVFC
jgi:hypothetical protein